MGKAGKLAPDLVNRDFTAKAPHRTWVADITYVPTNSGFLYVGIILDVFTRMIVGWSMRNDLGVELVVVAPCTCAASMKLDFLESMYV